MTMTIPPSDFPTRDLHLAAFLLARGRRLVGFDGPPHQLRFRFADVTPADVQEFYGEATVNARHLLNALRDLKGLVLEAGRR